MTGVQMQILTSPHFQKWVQDNYPKYLQWRNTLPSMNEEEVIREYYSIIRR